MQTVVRSLPSIGGVGQGTVGVPWLVFFPDGVVHDGAEAWFRELAASDLGAGSFRSYGYDLLRWFRWLHACGVEWPRAGREQVRDLVVFMREAPMVRRGGPVEGLVAEGDGGRAGFAARTINHQLAVLSGFYDFAIETGTGPLVNPVPPAGRGTRRVVEHRSPLEPWPVVRRAAYRQRVPRQTPRSLPDTAVVFTMLRHLPAYQGTLARHQADAEAALVRVMIRTGKALLAVTGEDLLAYADLVATSGRVRREHLAWELMVALGPFAGEAPTLRAAWTSKGNTRQYSAAGLVGRFGLPASGVRDLLVEYLRDIRPGLDYRSWEGIAFRLCYLFWRTVLEINPGQADLRLSPEVAAEWRERTVLTLAGEPRRDHYSILFTVRAFYRDIGQWSLEDPACWARWAAPSPVRDVDVRGLRKALRQRQARMQQRTRTLTPLLPKLVATARQRRDHGVALLAAATAAAHGEAFVIDGSVYERHDPPTRGGPRNQRSNIWVRDDTGALVDVTNMEAGCFWAWALIETLRLTGARIEEVLELTQLSLRHYTPPTTGTLVPLLHIVPSKFDTERLIPMSPELVEVILAVQRRAKGSAASVPLSIRYDPLEKTHGPPLPHLFARLVGTRQEVLSNHYIRTLLNTTAEAAGLSDNGEPVRFTPHDFRRLFTTDVVGAGLPLHIAAALLGHMDLDTTRGYTAVFQDELIARHQQFITRRRALRDSAEYRDVTAEEWGEFEKHFQLRRVALGDCFRPYGTPCVHEHACIRCPHLRLDPAQAPLLDDIEANTQLRRTEASEKGWLGEVSALEETLHHIGRKRTQLPA